MNTKELVRIALCSAVICVLAPFSIPIGPVPISLATLGVYIAAGILGSKKGTIAVIIYILIGIAGVPVFSEFGSGLGKVLSVTGGYLIGYIPCAFISGKIIENSLRDKKSCMIAFVIATIVLYAFGTAWFMLQTKNSLIESLTMCVFPFIIGDLFKIVAASFVSEMAGKLIID